MKYDITLVDIRKYQINKHLYFPEFLMNLLDYSFCPDNLYLYRIYGFKGSFNYYDLWMMSDFIGYT